MREEVKDVSFAERQALHQGIFVLNFDPGSKIRTDPYGNDGHDGHDGAELLSIPFVR